MWSSVVVLALLTAADPVRLGVTFLMISRPQPKLNLLAYWVGCLAASIPAVLVPLLVLHFAPMFAPMMANAATTASTTVRPLQVGMGVLALLIAVVMTARFAARQRAQLRISDGNPSTLVLTPNTPTVVSRLFGQAGDATSDGGSTIRRLVDRARNAWESGSLWVAFVVGIASGPPPIQWIFLLTSIVASGAAIGTQITAAVAFVIGMLAVAEIMLVSYLATPVKTEAVIRRLHDWVWANRRRLIVTIFAVLGASMVASGI